MDPGLGHIQGLCLDPQSDRQYDCLVSPCDAYAMLLQPAAGGQINHITNPPFFSQTRAFTDNGHLRSHDHGSIVQIPLQCPTAPQRCRCGEKTWQLSLNS